MSSSSMPWIKLYVETLDDPKMGRLNDRLWRRSIEVFMLAGKTGAGGFLPPIEDMAWILRTTPEELAAELEELARVNIVNQTEDGWCVTHFAVRQDADSNAERQRRYRERQQHDRYEGNEEVTEKEVIESNETVTECNDASNEKDNELSQRLRLRLREDQEGEEEGGASTSGASAPEPPKPPASPSKLSDPRSKHPAILCAKGVARHYPPLEIYDEVIRVLGEHPDGAKLATCRQEWVKRGYNGNAWAWLTDWYLTGIPPGGPKSPPVEDKTDAAIRRRLEKASGK